MKLWTIEIIVGNECQSTILIITKTKLHTWLFKVPVYVLATEGLLKHCAPPGYHPETDGHTEWAFLDLDSDEPVLQQPIEGCATGLSSPGGENVSKSTWEGELNTSFTGPVKSLAMSHLWGQLLEAAGPTSSSHMGSSVLWLFQTE